MIRARIASLTFIAVSAAAQPQAIAKTQASLGTPINQCIDFKNGTQDERIAGCKAVIASKESDTDALHAAHTILGSMLLRQSMTDEAIVHFSEAIRLEPNNGADFGNRGMAYFTRGDTTLAFADFDKALTLDPTLAHIFATRGLAYAVVGDNEKAINDYTDALKLKPDDAEVLAQRAAIHFKVGDLKHARDDANAAAKLDPQITSHPTFGSFLQDMTGPSKP